MKLSKEEILKIAKIIKLEITDQELEEIQNEIMLMTKRVDEMINLVDLCDEKFISPNENINVYSSNENECSNVDVLKYTNNFDGKYINTKQVIGDE